MNRWIRLGVQTAFGLALLWLWLRTVSLPEILAHAHVHSWWAVALMVVLFLVTSMIRARRWLLLLRPLAPVPQPGGPPQPVPEVYRLVYEPVRTFSRMSVPLGAFVSKSRRMTLSS